MRITVTTQDIEAGRRRDPGECPVARALRRAGISHFGVTGMLVIVQTGRNHVPLVLPANVQTWILDFDWGSAMSPIDFELELPGEQERRDTRAEATPPSRGAALLPRVTARSRKRTCAPAPARLFSLCRWSASAKALVGRTSRCCGSPRTEREDPVTEPEQTLVPS